MNIYFENINFIYIAILFIVISFLFLKLLKINKKQKFIFSILSIFFLLCFFSHPFKIANKRIKETAFLIDISNSMPSTNDLYEKIKPLYDEKKDKIFIFSKTSSPFPIEIYDLKDTATLVKTWENLGLNETLIKKNIENLILQNNFKKIVLYTDGYEKNEELKKYLNNNSYGDIKIYPLIPSFKNEKDKNITSSDIKIVFNETSKTKQKMPIKIILDESKKISGKIAVYQEDEKILDKSFSKKEDEYFEKSFFSLPIKQGNNNLKIKILDDNNEKIVQKKINISGINNEKILLLSNSHNDAFFLEKILKNIGYDVTSIIEDKSNEKINLNSYAVVILNNFPYKKLGNDNAKNIENFVRKGKNLVMIGGEHSLSLGGYKETIIEDVLPVILEDNEKKVLRQNLGIALVLDSSGSMEENSKIDFLRMASEKLISNLKEDDFIGIVGFNTTSFTVFPITQVKNSKNLAINSLSLLKPQGGTNLAPALNDAIEMLSSVRTAKKHLILLTDGKIPGEAKTFINISQIIKMIGSSLSTILLGTSEGETLLKEMATIGKGNFYKATSIDTLPNIFIKDLELVKDDMAIKENRYDVKTGELQNISLTNFPFLKGFLLVKPKENAKTELLLSSFSEEQPLLVTKDYNEGTSCVFSSDMNGRWSSEWIKWDDINLFWEQFLKNIIQRKNKTSKNILDYNFSHYINGSDLILEFISYKNISKNDITLDVLLPNKKTKNIDLKELAIGRFIATIPNYEMGEYKIFLKYKNYQESPLLLYVDEEQKSEMKHSKPYMPLLTLIAKQTNGKINPTLNDLKTKDKIKSKKYIDDIFVIIALVFFLIGIFKREIS